MFKKLLKINRIETLSLIVITSFILLLSCTDKGNRGDPPLSEKKAVISNNGETITFPSGSPGLKEINTIVAKKGEATISVIAPARVVAMITSGLNSNDKTVIFESSDLTTLYSSYKQAKQNVIRTSKNLARTKEMFENQAVTAREVNDAETDALNANNSLAEMEGRLRTAGYNPNEIENAKIGSMWIISDVPESQLKDVDKGEDVDIRFDSYPDKKFIGRVDAIGDVLDPATRTVKVRVIISRLPVKFLPGMFCRVDFGDPIKSVITLPLSSIVTVDGKDYTFVETSDGIFVRRQVITTISGDTNVVVMKGINDDDKVVSSGTILLKGLSFGY